jgi:hypothetical protein
MHRRRNDQRVAVALDRRAFASYHGQARRGSASRIRKLVSTAGSDRWTSSRTWRTSSIHSAPGERHVREVDFDHLRARFEWRGRKPGPRSWRRDLGSGEEGVVLAPRMLLAQAEAQGELSSIAIPGRFELRVDRAAEPCVELGDSPFGFGATLYRGRRSTLTKRATPNSSARTSRGVVREMRPHIGWTYWTSERDVKRALNRLYNLMLIGEPDESHPNYKLIRDGLPSAETS